MKEDHLFTLIKSLKKTEKSYFKKVKSAFGGKDSSIMKLFDTIQKQEEYDETKVLKQMKDEPGGNSFSVKKFSLYNNILDVLVYSKSKSSDVLWQISRLISHGIVLKEKALFKGAAATFQKAAKLAEENEFFYKRIEINQQLIEIFRKSRAMTDFNALNELEEIRLNTLFVSEQISNAERYFILSDKLHRKAELFRHTANIEIQNEINELHNDEILSSEDKAMSKSALVCYHYIHYLKHFGQSNQSEKALYHLKSIIDLQEMVERFPLRSRFVQMGNYVRLATESGLKEDALDMLKRMEGIIQKSKDNFLQIFHYVHVNFYHVQSKNQKDYFNFHLELEKQLDDVIENVPFNMEVMDLKHAQFHYYFMKGEFKKAYMISNYLDHQYNLHSFKNGKLIEKLLKTICAFEMNDYDLMSSEIRAVKYLLKSTPFPLKSELEAFETMRLLHKSNSDENNKKILLKYIDSVKNSEEEETKVSFLFNGFDFKKWANSKLNKTDYSKLYFNA